MALKVNPVTLTLYSSPKGRYHHPKRRGRCRPPERSEHNLPPTGGHNPRGEAPSILTPKACPRVRSKNDTGRRLAVRIAMGCQIGALPRTPFPASRDFAPVGSMSLDFQIASLSYKSSSFATSRGNEKYGEEKQRVIYFMYHSAVSPLVANAVSQSPACVSCHMIHKANLVTLTSYSSPIRAIPQPSA